MKNTVFTGAGVAIVTPFHEDLSVNYDKLDELLEEQIARGTDAIVICGTTGESTTLSPAEHEAVNRFAVQRVKGRVPVIAGCGSNETAFAAQLSQAAERDGADALLHVTPYYNKTSQRGLVKHFYYVADRVSIPVILYNVPSRTGLAIAPETYFELSKHPNIVGTKEACGDVSAIAKTARLCGDNLHIYSGNDDQVAALMGLGAKGVISVLSNVAPEAAHAMAAAGLAGDQAECLRLQMEWLDLCNDLFIDVNPIPVKAAMNLMGKAVGPCRLPLCEMSDTALAKLKGTLERHGLV